MEIIVYGYPLVVLFFLVLDIIQKKIKSKVFVAYIFNIVIGVTLLGVYLNL